MTDFNYDWSCFSKKIPIKASKDFIYSAWNSQDGLESWFLRKAEFKEPSGYVKSRHEKIQKGDTYVWMWHGWTDDIQEKGKILDTNGTDLLSFTFGDAGIVTITIKEYKNMQIVDLTQTEIPTDEKSKVNFHMGCGKGWTFYLTNLKSILEGGIDLRNKDVDMKEVINA